jgi:hypothetical protein
MPPIPAHATHISPCNPYQPMPPILAHATYTSPCHPCQSRPISPSFLFHLPTLLQNLAAQSERSCPVNVISLSGSTAGRRNNLSNSRTKGAPVTVFEIMVISVVFVGICAGDGVMLRLENALVGGRLPVTGASTHFSICSIDCASHHLWNSQATILRRI